MIVTSYQGLQNRNYRELAFFQANQVNFMAEVAEKERLYYYTTLTHLIQSLLSMEESLKSTAILSGGIIRLRKYCSS